MKRSKFSLSHYRLFSCDMGELVPVGLVEVLPGDTFQHATSLLVRVSPLLAPVMHPVHVRIHHWFVPHRLVWVNWEDFITGGSDGMNASPFPTVELSPAESGVGTLADYFGVPPRVSGTTVVSALPFRAYNLIWNEWYRDQDLQGEATVNDGNGADSTTDRTLRKIGWEKDYFTSARPWTQKGPEVSIPLTGDAPIRGLGTIVGAAPSGSTNVNETDRGAGVNYGNAYTNTPNGTMAIQASGSGTNAMPQVFADLTDVSAATINDLRLAFALQRYEEARARYGSRYTEYLAYLGVRSSDARLQRPEYLGGGKQTIQFSEVLQTGPDAPPDNVVGALKGHGIAAVRSNRYRRFFEEHGYVITLLSVRPRTMYTQGLARTLNRRVKEDFWQMELQHIGQQEVAKKEVYAESVDPDGVFGYQDRYDEYRRQESNVAGEFRTTELDFWHMARTFATEPVLNASFVQCNPTKRINAVQTNDVLWIMANHNLKARRAVASSGRSFIF